MSVDQGGDPSSDLNIEFGGEDLKNMSASGSSVRISAATGSKRPADSQRTAAGSRMTSIGAGVLVMATLCVIAGYMIVSSRGQTQIEPPAMKPTGWNPLPEEVKDERPPVRFVNPFDRTEVFEFPPDTTQAEARAMAAEILAERARQRAR